METEKIEAEEINEAPSEGGNTRAGRRLSWGSILNIIGIVLCVLLLPGFLIFTTLLVSSFIHADVPPSCLGYTPLMVESGSMSPLFDEDDLLLIRNRKEGEEYDAGTIICFRAEDGYVTHRIVEVTEDEGAPLYTTKGDANNANDTDRITEDRILGTYITHFNGMGKAMLFIQTPMGMVVCVLLPIFIIYLLFTVPPHISALLKKRKRKAQAEDAGDAPD